ncbi:uncharacterized protein I206_103274 [Kwoniella pini CBS 10737]|uniref:Uncharacterized protein n=1 Tax=Kwoniella pini CBS 10737 TaxID=1296096 RepID=A0A1B9IAH7_9TREE|nr:uncharacterized protein I206_01720 [Kwoniella pini CBS 10737]OCF52430.1 hypothetical protein I206_01720 [Kwoniella pini CBS 10737]
MKTLLTPFPTPLSNRQWFYLSVLQGVGAGIIDGGANFAVAYAMYHNQKDIKMWVLAKNTIAGDLGVTPIIQCLASMLITSTLVHTDLHHHAVAPLAFVWPHVEHLPDPREITDRFKRRSKKAESSANEKSTSPLSSPTPSIDHDNSRKGLGHYFKMLIRFIFEGTENNSLLSIPGSAPLPFRIILTAAQGAAIGIVFGLPLFLIFIIVLGPLYKHDNIAEVGWKWSPMVIKCVYGAVLGWITNPIIACLALGSQAEHHLIVIPEENLEEGQGQVQLDTEGIETIHGEEELQSPIPISPLPGTTLRVPSVNGTPTRPPARLRALSNLSTTSSRGRPPLTANCSNLSIVGGSSTSNRRGSMTSMPRTPRSAPLPNGEFNLLAPPITSNAPGTLGSGLTPECPGISPIGYGSQSRRGRTRGATISTFMTNVDSVGSSNYSYALGGTGGRAQRGNRPRAISSLSNTIQPQIQDDLNSQSINSPPIKINNFNSISSTENRSDRGRSYSDGLGISDTSGKKPVWDVFGQVKQSESNSKLSNLSPSKHMTLRHDKTENGEKNEETN